MNKRILLALFLFLICNNIFAKTGKFRFYFNVISQSKNQVHGKIKGSSIQIDIDKETYLKRKNKNGMIELSQDDLLTFVSNNLKQITTGGGGD